MREWYEISFTPTHTSCKSQHYNCVTDLEVGGKTIRQWELDAYNRGFDDALLYLQSHIDDLKKRTREY